MDANGAPAMATAADMVLEGVTMEQRGAFVKLAGVAQMIDAARASHVVPGAEDPRLPGGPRLVQFGADGTEPVPEFLVLEIAALLGTHEGLAQKMVTDVVNLRSRHPLAWQAMDQGLAEAWQARAVANACADAELSLAAARRIDAQLQPCWGHLPWPRIRERLRGLIRRADPDLARAKAEKARAERFVRIRHLDDSTSLLVARMASSDAVAIWEAISHLAVQAVAEGATAPLSILRTEALGALARPTNESSTPQLPPPGRAELVVHIAAEDLPGLETAAEGTRVGRVENRGEPLGPVLLTEIQELLAHRAVRVTPVIDLAGDPQIDSYEIPDRMRAQLDYRDVYSVFPYSSRRARHCDLDHTVAYQHRDPPKGQTRPTNLGHLSRKEHRWKTWDKGFRIAQMSSGSFVVTTPGGFRYLIDRGLTFRLHPRRE
ncbi:MAG: DUF222 domain-containing protein [Acidipropionibacterium sp.]|jgi:hypothetical protein|nr:DUF222 domain-containing protein [Acidipropionibacterium sp.]